MDSKTRAGLRAAANGIPTIFQIGKDGIGENLIAQVEGALNARELIKLRVLESSGIAAREAADIISARTSSEVVQVIGTRFVLFRASEKDDRKGTAAGKIRRNAEK